MDIRTVRIWVYSVIVAAGPLVVFYGAASADEVALWLGLGGTILGVPAGTTAIANINRKKPSVDIVENTNVTIEVSESDDDDDADDISIIAEDEEPDIDEGLEDDVQAGRHAEQV